jgi:hypothetical protein
MSEVMSEDDQFRAELDELGEEKVRARFILDTYSKNKTHIVVEWLAQQAEKRQSDAQECQELREDEALVLARWADERADQAHRVAWIAAAIAIAAIIVSVVK